MKQKNQKLCSSRPSGTLCTWQLKIKNRFCTPAVSSPLRTATWWLRLELQR